ncbi:hypothetical protein COR50_13935 [Chitinophaga caeni]|uniref:YncE family protein n=1 Tax=Chitinophaga caeni TaxID=2029983 RepID=A0A291QW59_9BACT|nr:hypothetical protein [Chitinophaga caeni]ATL48175.1 hypothetical protein COR50_13935 [Chitinophaga caeni]
MKDSQISSPQLSYAINNPGAPNTIYITDDPTVNKLSLLITLNLGVATFVPGTLVPKIDAPDSSGSLLYLDLKALQLSATEFNNLEVAATDWTFKLYPDTFTVGMTPTRSLSLGSGVGDQFSITINNLVMENPPSSPSASLNVTAFRVDPVATGKLPQVSFFKVLLQEAPSNKKNLPDAIVCDLNGSGNIFNSIDGYEPVSNQVSFLFKPGNKAANVLAGPDTVFTVSFVYADAWPGYGALTTPDTALNIEVRQGQNAEDWAVSQDPDAQNPSWNLVPKAGAPIIGEGVKSVVQFEVQKIVTTFEPGPTLMFVQYSHVPGYNDGSYYLVLNKIPHVDINELTVTPNPSTVKNGKAQVTVSWKVQHYVLLTLMPFYKDVTNMDSIDLDLETSLDITLVANGPGGATNTVMKTVSANVLPEINSFNATPTNIYKKDFPHMVKFYWDVDTNETVYLVNVSENTKEVVDRTGTLYKDVSQAGMWSIVPKNDSNMFQLRRNVLIEAFDQQHKDANLNYVPRKIVASPTAQFLAAMDPASKSIQIINSLTYDSYAPAIQLGAAPIDLIFSEDGTYLFTILENNSLVVIGISFDTGTSIYTFNILNTVQLDFKPASLALSQQNKYVYVSANDTGDQQGHLLVVEQLDPSTYAVKSDLPIGLNAAGIATDPSGAMIYVCNAGSDSVSVIAYNSFDDDFSITNTISDISGYPLDIVVADPLGNTLLVVCKNNGKLLAINHDDRGYSDRQELDLGGTPVSIDVTYDRAYAFITNDSTNSVSLIGCGAGVGNCKILEQGIPVVAHPDGISLSMDDTMVFVASNSEQKFTIINLVNYQLKGNPTDVGKSPTGVIVSNDNKYAVTWHSALISMGNDSDVPGLYIYNTLTGTVTLAMKDTEVIDAVFSQALPVTKMFMVSKSNNSIDVLSTSDFTSELKIPIPDATSGEKRYPNAISISASGQNMYVVTKDSKGNYSMLIYSCDIGSNVYKVIFDQELFNSTVKSNLVLLANSPSGNHAFVLDVFSGNLYTVKRDAGGTFELLNKDITISSIAKSMICSPSNNTLYILTQINLKTGFTILDIETMEVRNYTYPVSYGQILNLQRLAISPDGSRLFATDADMTGVRIINATNLRIVQTLSYESNIRYPMGIAMVPDASAIYFTGMNSGNIAQLKQINS